MVRPRLCRAVVAAVMCVGTGALTSGVAHASTTLVFSDTIKFSATLARDGTVHATKCNLTSDAEPVSFVCQATGRVFPPPQIWVMTFHSADGTIKSSFTLTSTPLPNTYRLKGTGTEEDNADPGQPPPPPYDCVLTGTLTHPAANPLTNNVTIRVRESSTAP